MRYKGKRFSDNKEKVNNKSEEVFVDVVEDDDNFDVTETPAVVNDSVSEAVMNSSEEKADEAFVDTSTMSLKDKRKMVKEGKKLREKQEKERKELEPEVSQEKVSEKEPKQKKEKSPKPKKERVKKSSDKGEKKTSNVIQFKNKDSSKKSFSSLLHTLKHNRKSIIFALVIILVLVVAVLGFANRDRLTFSNIKNWVQYGVLNKDKEEQFPLSTDGDVINNGNFTRIDSNLLYASDTKFATLNSYGRTIFSYPQSFTSPALSKAADCDLSIVYNLGGKEFYINDLDETIYSGEAQDNILVADVSKSGVYAVVTAKDGYLSKLYVYSKDHKQIFAYSFADYYITSVSLDSKGKTAVLSGISAHDGSQLSCVYLLDFKKEEPVVFEEINENILYYVEHLNNNYCCIIGENACYTLNARTKSLKTTNYDGKTLTAFDVNTDTDTFTLSLSRSGDGRMCDVFSFSTSGALKHEFSTDLMIRSISTYKNRVSALTTDTLYLYTKDGHELSETTAGLAPHCAVLYSKNDAYVLGASEIRRLDL